MGRGKRNLFAAYGSRQNSSPFEPVVSRNLVCSKMDTDLSNKNIIMSSFKSSGDIQKKEGGPDSCFG